MKEKWTKVKEKGLELDESMAYKSELINLGIGLEQIISEGPVSTDTITVAHTLQVETNYGFEQITLHFGENYHVHLNKRQAEKLFNLLQDGNKIITQNGLDSEMKA